VYLLHIFLAGVFMCLWVRELGGANVAAAFAGIAYMLCSFVSYPFAWPHIILCHTWIPIVFYCVHRAFFRARWADAVLLGVAAACQFLAGYMQGFVYTLYGGFGYLIFMALTELAGRERRPWRVGRSFALAAVGLIMLPALLTAFQWIPAFKLSALSARPPGGLARDAILVGGSLYPSIFFRALINPDSFKWAQYTLYPGVVVLVMAAFAFAQWKRRRELAFFSAMAVISALIAFGTYTPVFSLYMNLPSGDWFRLPNRLLILTAFSIATLAGMGCSYLVDDVLAKPSPSSHAAGRYAIFIAICAAFILLLPKGAGLYVFVLLIGCLLGGRGRSAPIVGVLAALLVGLDLTLYVFNPITYPWITREVFPELKEEKNFLGENLGLDRVHVFHRKHDWKNFLLNANFGMVERIRETSGYESLSLRRYAEFCAYLETGGQPSDELPFTGALRWTSESAYPHMLNLLGARYIVEDPGRALYPENAPSNEPPKGFRLSRVFSGELKIYENPDALPRAFYVSNVEVIRNKREVLKRLADRSFDYRSTIVLEEEPEPPAAPPDPSATPSSPEVIVKPRGEGEIGVVVDVPGSGYIVLNDILLPGWHAKVGGSDSKIYRANYLLMAVPVEAGKHAIEVQYKPPGFRAGKWISFGTAMFLFLSLAFDVARRRAKKMAPWERTRLRA
ncbi:MAG: YfhO family protein, partial [Candidatus Hydrogenedentota bacterium]